MSRLLKAWRAICAIPSRVEAFVEDEDRALQAIYRIDGVVNVATVVLGVALAAVCVMGAIQNALVGQ